MAVGWKLKVFFMYMDFDIYKRLSVKSMPNRKSYREIISWV